MNPRRTPFKEYFPAATLVNPNLPSSPVTMASCCCGFFTLTRETRAPASGCPSVLLTTVPATRKGVVELRLARVALCAKAIEGKIARAVTSANQFIRDRNRIRVLPLLIPRNQLQLEAHFLIAFHVDHLSFVFESPHGFGIAIREIRMLKLKR